MSDVVCTSGPQDRAFEERHSNFSIAIALAGSFQYRGSSRSRADELMTPGSLLLGNAGQHFECGHEHGAGDRCLSFQYAPEYFEQLGIDAGLRVSSPEFRTLRLPPMRVLSPLVARACAGLNASIHPLEMPWEQLSIRFAALALQLANGHAHSPTTRRQAPWRE